MLKDILLSFLSVTLFVLIFTLGNDIIAKIVLDDILRKPFAVSFFYEVKNLSFIAVLCFLLVNIPKKISRGILLTALILASSLWFFQMSRVYGWGGAIRGQIGTKSAVIDGAYISPGTFITVWEILFYLLLAETILSYGRQIKVWLILFVCMEIWFIAEALIRVELKMVGWEIIPYALRIGFLLLLTKFLLPKVGSTCGSSMPRTPAAFASDRTGNHGASCQKP